MSKAKKCYNCLSEVDADAAMCPKCDIKLGARTKSGVAAKPGSLFLKIFLVIVGLGVAAKLTGYSHLLNAAPEKAAPAQVEISRGALNVKDAAIKEIKEKGAKDLSAVGVTDVGYKDDTLLVYVDKRFENLSRSQQEQLLAIVAAEWKKAIGKDTTAVNLVEYGTEKLLAELVV
jgi:hypothetical protein